MVFTGTYEHTIDAKSRLAVPSDVRRQLLAAAVPVPGDPGGAPVETPVFMYVTLGERNTLCLYAERDFEKRAEQLDNSELEADELLAYEQLMFSLAARVELDAQGRIRLPEHLLKMAKLGTDVVLIGVKDHLEVRDRAAWQAYVQQTLAANPGILMNPRRAMRQRKARDGAEA